jgi:thioredoxin-dependent peroxiredoxin
VILGASFDTPAENKAFAEAQGFPYRLLSDVSTETGEAYGVKKGPDEQWAAFPRRHTILIAPDGTIRTVWEVSDVAANAADVLAEIAAATA